MATNTGGQLITIDPDILGGVPCFFGTRVPLAVLFDNLRDGLTLDEILDSYPTLSRKLVVKVLENPDQVRRARNVHQANGIVNLDRPGLSKEVAEVQNRIIAGELTPRQAIDMKIAQLKNDQRMRQENAEMPPKIEVTAYVTAAGDVLTATFQTGGTVVGTLEQVATELRVCAVRPEAVTMPDKLADDAPTTGQRIALIAALRTPWKPPA